MQAEKLKKYRPYPIVPLHDRTWPDKTITEAPLWCSVDLRDGNQALRQPMNLEQKLEMFQLLVDIGFKEIEVGFPAASKVEFDFLRLLIEDNLIPEDVTVQVLTQAREHLIRKSFAALQGARKAIVHLYNSTSTLQRQVVFKMDRKEIIQLGVQGAEVIREEAGRFVGDIRYEYSPESFTGTELDFALEICEEVMKVWQPTPEKPVVINLPATVEMATANIYADQIEWFGRNMKNRDCALISLHAHNDRGSAVAATELALMAGADRIEGTLFGNGERTGNVDIVTLALNMFSQGVDPKLDFSNINRVVNVYKRCTDLPVHPRHPYAGDLVYTAFSGSHQDAISKGMDAVADDASGVWAVPYLPIDPEDVGRSYESIICINSQSGKGGAAYIMDRQFGFKLPKAMRPGFGRVVQEETEKVGSELSNKAVYGVFEREYLREEGYYRLKEFNVVKRHIDQQEERSTATIEAIVVVGGEERQLQGNGNGPLDAMCSALNGQTDLDFILTSYDEHSLTEGASSKAVTYIELMDRRENGSRESWWGAGMDTDIIVSSVKALLRAVNRMHVGR
ncbi:MAG: 2-isopropylmalate synthase [Candidatus Electrothrix aestuarii]|uniref:2-isopropylmalate synthase n=1 Tax=Candidatus Electrothrix aestuarii TaxID=3062594 RepID=A0AAU8LQ43_9BACT|nr:2-isopropylmalate synthase [Candidatus Electrothrix aestuarii]